MRKCVFLAALMLVQSAQAVKFFRDVLPAIGAGTTVAVNIKTLIHGTKKAGHTVKTAAKKVAGKK